MPKYEFERCFRCTRVEVLHVEADSEEEARELIIEGEGEIIDERWPDDMEVDPDNDTLEFIEIVDEDDDGSRPYLGG